MIPDWLYFAIWAAVIGRIVRQQLELARLLKGIGWAYQAIGARWPDKKSLDNLSALCAGKKPPHQWVSVPPLPAIDSLLNELLEVDPGHELTIARRLDGRIYISTSEVFAVAVGENIEAALSKYQKSLGGKNG